MNFEQIVLILTTLVGREVGGQIILWLRGRRGEKHDEIQDIWAENRALRKEIEELSQRLQETQTEIAQLRGFYHNITAWSDLNCPIDGKRCWLGQLFKDRPKDVVPMNDGAGWRG